MFKAERHLKCVLCYFLIPIKSYLVTLLYESTDLFTSKLVSDWTLTWDRTGRLCYTKVLTWSPVNSWLVKITDENNILTCYDEALCKAWYGNVSCSGNHQWKALILPKSYLKCPTSKFDFWVYVDNNTDSCLFKCLSKLTIKTDKQLSYQIRILIWFPYRQTRKNIVS